MKYRLIVSDIDGTLTTEWDKVNAGNRRVLRKLVDQGVSFMIATGRSYNSAKAILDSLNLPCYACLNNGAVLLSYPDLELVQANYLTIDEKNFLIEKILQAKGHVTIDSGFEGGDKIYYTERFHLSPILKQIVDKAKKQTLFVKNMIADILHPVPGISCVGNKEEIGLIQKILNPYRENFNILELKDTFFEGFYWLMISAQDVDKVQGIKKIATQLGIAQEEILAIGDDLNDLEMIKYAGLGIAMENGRSELKAIADRIAPCCAEDGFAKVLEEIYAE